MPIFFDRQEAAHLITEKLSFYKQHPNTIVLGLAHGGAVMAAIIGQELQLPFNVLTPRKIGSPQNQELAIGAIAQDGQRWLNSALIHSLGLSASLIEQLSTKELKQAKHLAKLYAQTKPLQLLKNKIVIIVDDGIATGATMHVTMQSLRHQEIQKLIIAAPVAAKEVWNKLAPMADAAYCLLIVEDFFGVCSFYQHFEPVEDATVISLLKKS
jgi:putative phosphoribosyl transferase